MPPCPNFSSTCRELTCKSAHSDLVKNLERSIVGHKEQREHLHFELLTKNLTSNVGLNAFCYDHVLQPLLDFVSSASQKGSTVLLDASHSRGGLLFYFEMSVDKELSDTAVYMLLRDYFNYNGHADGLPVLFMGLTFESHPIPWLNTCLHECYDVEFQLQFPPQCIIRYSSKTDQLFNSSSLPSLMDISA